MQTTGAGSTRSFWAEEYAGYDERFQREAIAPIQNKLGQFLLNPVTRNILGQVRRRTSIPFVMNRERLFIANLSKGRIGHDKANLLGSLLTTQFQLAATVPTRSRFERECFRHGKTWLAGRKNSSRDHANGLLRRERK